jgi:hypothetical protein
MHHECQILGSQDDNRDACRAVGWHRVDQSERFESICYHRLSADGGSLLIRNVGNYLPTLWRHAPEYVTR